MTRKRNVPPSRPAAESPQSTPERAAEAKAPECNSMFLLVTRVVWMFVGPMTLVILLYSIFTARNGWFFVADAAFAAVLVVTVGCRWLEQRSGRGATSTGELSTWSDFRRYAITTTWVAVMGWGVAKLAGMLFLRGPTLS